MDIVLLLLGSALTIIGGYIGSAHAAKLARASEHRQILREKLEKLGELAISCDDWINKLADGAFADPQKDTPSDPVDQVDLLVDLYVPELRAQSHLFGQSFRDLCQCVLREASRRLKSKLSPPSAERDKIALQVYADEYLETHKKFLQHRTNFLSALADFARLRAINRE